MVIYSNAARQVLAPGQSLVLNKISGCSSCNVNPNPGATVKGSGNFLASFTGNISTATAATPVELSMVIDGIVAPTTRMISSPSTADVFNNVSALTGFSGNCCCMGTNVTIVNTGTSPVTVEANSNLTIWKD